MFWWPTTQLIDGGVPGRWTVKKLKFAKLFFAQLTATRAGIKEEEGLEDEGSLPIAYWFLVILRFALTLVPQGGCVHPDEFFQTLEPVAGSILDVEWKRSWELNTTFPLRNLALPFLSIGTPLKILQIVNYYLQDYAVYNLITPYTLLVIPRLFYCLISFVNDYCLLKICDMYGNRINTKLILFASSYVTLVYSTRTFSNSLEVVLFSVLLLIVSDCMRTSKYIEYHRKIVADKYAEATDDVVKVKYFKISKLIPDNSLSQCFHLATITMFGIFNRPTFVAFAFPAIFLWLLRGLGSEQTGFKEFHSRVIVFVLSCLPALVFLIVFDSGYHGYLSMSDIDANEVGINNFVVTPLNFLRYNMFSENLAQHGLHPRWLHILINVPLLFNVLGVIGLISAISVCYRLSKGYFATLPRVQSISGLMTLSAIIPIATLSIFPHQEPRFLIPIHIPIIVLCSNGIEYMKNDSKTMKKFKMFLFVIGCCHNIIATIFFGFVHQGGLYPVANHLQSEISAKPNFENIHIVTSHIYDLPHTLLLNKDPSRMRYDPKTKQKYKLSKQTFLYELRSKPMRDVVKQVRVIWNISHEKLKNSKKLFRLYLVLPGSMRSELNAEWGETNFTSLVFKEEYTFYPHFSGEALPYYPLDNDQTCLSDFHNALDVSSDIKLTKFGQMFCLLRQFSLTVYKIDKKSNFAD